MSFNIFINYCLICFIKHKVKSAFKKKLTFLLMIMARKMHGSKQKLYKGSHSFSEDFFKLSLTMVAMCQRQTNTKRTNKSFGKMIGSIDLTWSSAWSRIKGLPTSEFWDRLLGWMSISEWDPTGTTSEIATCF